MTLFVARKFVCSAKENHTHTRTGLRVPASLFFSSQVPTCPDVRQIQTYGRLFCFLWRRWLLLLQIWRFVFPKTWEDDVSAFRYGPLLHLLTCLFLSNEPLTLCPAQLFRIWSSTLSWPQFLSSSFHFLKQMVIASFFLHHLQETNAVTRQWLNCTRMPSSRWRVWPFGLKNTLV